MSTEPDQAIHKAGGRRRDPVSPEEERQQARLRVVLDRKLGRETPDWIREIAES